MFRSVSYHSLQFSAKKLDLVFPTFMLQFPIAICANDKQQNHRHEDWVGCENLSATVDRVREMKACPNEQILNQLLCEDRRLVAIVQDTACHFPCCHLLGKHAFHRSSPSHGYERRHSFPFQLPTAEWSKVIRHCPRIEDQHCAYCKVRRFWTMSFFSGILSMRLNWDVLLVLLVYCMTISTAPSCSIVILPLSLWIARGTFVIDL